VYYKLAWSHDKAGRLREALEAYRAVADKYPQSEVAPDAAFRVGRVLQELGEHQQAADQFAGLLQKQGLDKETAARTRFYLAESLRALKKWADALRLYRELGQPDSGFDPAYLAFYGAGACALELDALQDAWDGFTQVVQRTETETAAMAQLGLGEALYRQKKFVDASREFLKVDILYGYPKWKPRALLRAAQSFKEAGQADRAARYLTKLIETYPDSQEAAEAQNMRKELK